MGGVSLKGSDQRLNFSRYIIKIDNVYMLPNNYIIIVSTKFTKIELGF